MESETEKVMGYCVKCKSKKEFKSGTEELVEKKVNKRQVNFLMGKCLVCGTKMSKILPKKLLEKEKETK